MSTSGHPSHLQDMEDDQDADEEFENWCSAVNDTKFDILKFSRRYATKQPRTLKMYVPETDGYLMPEDARITISKVDSHKQEIVFVRDLTSVRLSAGDDRMVTLDYTDSVSDKGGFSVLFRSFAERQLFCHFLRLLTEGVAMVGGSEWALQPPTGANRLSASGDGVEVGALLNEGLDPASCVVHRCETVSSGLAASHLLGLRTEMTVTLDYKSRRVGVGPGAAASATAGAARERALCMVSTSSATMVLHPHSARRLELSYRQPQMLDLEHAHKQQALPSPTSAPESEAQRSALLRDMPLAGAGVGVTGSGVMQRALQEKQQSQSQSGTSSPRSGGGSGDALTSGAASPGKSGLKRWQLIFPSAYARDRFASRFRAIKLGVVDSRGETPGATNTATNTGAKTVKQGLHVDRLSMRRMSRTSSVAVASTERNDEDGGGQGGDQKDGGQGDDPFFQSSSTTSTNAVAGAETLKILCATFNVGDKAPPTKAEDAFKTLDPWLKAGECDVYAVCLQECSQPKQWLKTLKEVLGGEKATQRCDKRLRAEAASFQASASAALSVHAGGGHGGHGRFEAGQQQQQLRAAAARLAGVGKGFAVVAKESLWEILVVLVMRGDLASARTSEVATATEATGFAHVLGNKGAAAVAFTLDHTTRLCFVSSHLAARASRMRKRQENYEEICAGLKKLRRKLDGNREGAVEWMHGFDHVFWAGDLNYRLNFGQQGTPDEFDKVLSLVQRGRHPELQQADTLTQNMVNRAVFAGFEEGAINFLPTYRMIKGVAKGYNNKNNQNPSYTDRVLYRSAPGLASHHLSLLWYEAETESAVFSDHRPVAAGFEFVPRDPFALRGGLRRAGAFDECLIVLRSLTFMAAPEPVNLKQLKLTKWQESFAYQGSSSPLTFTVQPNGSFLPSTTSSASSSTSSSASLPSPQCVRPAPCGNPETCARTRQHAGSSARQVEELMWGGLLPHWTNPAPVCLRPSVPDAQWLSHQHLTVSVGSLAADGNSSTDSKNTENSGAAAASSMVAQAQIPLLKSFTEAVASIRESRVEHCARLSTRLSARLSTRLSTAPAEGGGGARGLGRDKGGNRDRLSSARLTSTAPMHADDDPFGDGSTGQHGDTGGHGNSGAGKSSSSSSRAAVLEARALQRQPWDVSVLEDGDLPHLAPKLKAVYQPSPDDEDDEDDDGDEGGAGFSGGVLGGGRGGGAFFAVPAYLHGKWVGIVCGRVDMLPLHGVTDTEDLQETKLKLSTWYELTMRMRKDAEKAAAAAATATAAGRRGGGKSTVGVGVSVAVPQQAAQSVNKRSGGRQNMQPSASPSSSSSASLASASSRGEELSTAMATNSRKDHQKKKAAKFIDTDVSVVASYFGVESVGGGAGGGGVSEEAAGGGPQALLREGAAPAASDDDGGSRVAKAAVSRRAVDHSSLGPQVFVLNFNLKRQRVLDKERKTKKLQVASEEALLVLKDEDPAPDDDDDDDDDDDGAFDDVNEVICDVGATVSGGNNIDDADDDDVRYRDIMSAFSPSTPPPPVQQGSLKQKQGRQRALVWLDTASRGREVCFAGGTRARLVPPSAELRRDSTQVGAEEGAGEGAEAVAAEDFVCCVTGLPLSSGSLAAAGGDGGETVGSALLLSSAVSVEEDDFVVVQRSLAKGFDCYSRKGFKQVYGQRVDAATLQPLTKEDHFVTALGGAKFRTDNFRCAHTGQELFGVQFFEVGGRAYGEKAFLELFHSCPGCAQAVAIDDRHRVKALGAVWHACCLVCVGCTTHHGSTHASATASEEGEGQADAAAAAAAAARGSDANDASPSSPTSPPPSSTMEPNNSSSNGSSMVGLVDKVLGDASAAASALQALSPPQSLVGLPCFAHDASDGRGALPYCEDCFLTKFCPVCGGCGEPINTQVEDVLEACGSTWHPSHFRCASSGVVLDGDFFTSPTDDDGLTPYCPQEFHRLFGKRCVVCCEVITAEHRIEALDQTWHVECFVCMGTGLPLATATTAAATSAAATTGGADGSGADGSGDDGGGEGGGAATSPPVATIVDVEFWEHEGRPYSRSCFFEWFGEKCFFCQEPCVEEQRVTCPLLAVNHVKDLDPDYLHRRDSQASAGEAAAGEAAVEEAKDGEGAGGADNGDGDVVEVRRVYHPECLHCVRTGVNLGGGVDDDEEEVEEDEEEEGDGGDDGGEVFLGDDDGLPYCEQAYLDVFRSRSALTGLAFAEGEDIFVTQGLPVSKQDLAELFHEHWCAGCGQAVTGKLQSTPSLGNFKWHPLCLENHVARTTPAAAAAAAGGTGPTAAATTGAEGSGSDGGNGSTDPFAVDALRVERVASARSSFQVKAEQRRLEKAQVLSKARERSKQIRRDKREGLTTGRATAAAGSKGGGGGDASVGGEGIGAARREGDGGGGGSFIVIAAESVTVASSASSGEHSNSMLVTPTMTMTTEVSQQPQQKTMSDTFERNFLEEEEAKSQKEAAAAAVVLVEVFTDVVSTHSPPPPSSLAAAPVIVVSPESVTMTQHILAPPAPPAHPSSPIPPPTGNDGGSDENGGFIDAGDTIGVTGSSNTNAGSGGGGKHNNGAPSSEKRRFSVRQPPAVSFSSVAAMSGIGGAGAGGLEFKGYLHKQGGGSSLFGAKSWKKRWFVLRAGGTLSYYKDDKDWSSGCAPLKDAVYKVKSCNVAQDTSAAAADGGGGSSGASFGIIVQPRTAAGGPRRLLLRTETEDELSRWMKVLLSYSSNKPKGSRN